MRRSILHRAYNARFAAGGSGASSSSSSSYSRSAAFCYSQQSSFYCTTVSDGDNDGPKKRPRVPPGSPFYSKYYKLGQSEVEAFLKRHEVTYKKTGRHAIVKECPFCHPTKGLHSNMHKLYVLLSTGVYMCHRCSAKGSWFELRQQIAGECVPVIGLTQVGATTGGSPEDPLFTQYSDDNLDYNNVDDVKIQKNPKVPCPPRASLKKYQELLDRMQVADKVLETRGLTKETLKKYDVGASFSKFRDDDGNYKEDLCYMFPMFSSRRKLMRYKVRSVSTKKFMKLEPKGGDWGVFGFNSIPANLSEVVLTEGEFDAMAVYQATSRPAISLPNGASSLPVSVVQSLERFKTIYLWMDDDIPGRDGARQFGKKLGRNRCRIVSTNGAAKDANDALLKKLDLENFITKAMPVPHEGVATFKDLKNEVYNEIMHPKQLAGIQSTLLPKLTDILGGHRRGELTIYSGHTGTGKTTLLSQISLDFCKQGIPTLWGSFEIRNVRLARLLLEQMYASETGKDVSTLRDCFDEWAEMFEEIPMYFMRYFGNSPIEKVIDAMEYGNYVHDISHVLLDNLQFMVGSQGKNSFEKFDYMDNAVAKLRQFSTQHNVHVGLVVHPRKENDDMEIQTASIFGSAKATQEADNVVILQRIRGNGGRLLQVRKNRFDGSLGGFQLQFDKSSKLFREKDNNNNKARNNNNVLPEFQDMPPFFSHRQENNKNNNKAWGKASTSSAEITSTTRIRKSNNNTQLPLIVDKYFAEQRRKEQSSMP